MQEPTNIAGLIFLGGKARRLNGLDKASLSLAGRSCFEHISGCLHPHLSRLYVSTGMGFTTEKYEGFPVIRDKSQDKSAGMSRVLLDCLQYIHNKEQDLDINYVVTTTVDTPFLPENYVETLVSACQPYRPVVAVSNRIVHGLHALWPLSSIEKLENLVSIHQKYKLQLIHSMMDSIQCHFEPEEHRYKDKLIAPEISAADRSSVYFDETGGNPDDAAGDRKTPDQPALAENPEKFLIDPFFNINTPADLRYLERLNGRTAPPDHTT